MVERRTRGTRRVQLSRMRDSSTRSQVYSQLRSEIITLTMKPGQVLSESELAEVYGVSRTPVREALIRLADESLVEVVPQLGTYVSRISVREVREAQFIRETLERASLPLAIKRITPVDEAQLRLLLATQADAGERGDLIEWFSTDEQLHRALLEIAGHPKTWSVVSSIKAHLDRVRMLSLPEPEILSSMHGQHATLVDHVVAKRTQQADKLLTQHLRGVLGVLEPLEKQHPDYFQLDEEHDVRSPRPAGRAR
ncbi:GntR family transcriptional regulator [Kribbella pittospori]|uniref:GntR family transcriptional regulator n=1 Tax=Kribbella pittospori TaxID=722689 RepID=A0A4R0KY78_9ACTN|nr:GntR family transcriptional regulator [Kribbella pittospori]TCC61125.1 GntR family transcriptional regulator [Kribbella pittospori]